MNKPKTYQVPKADHPWRQYKNKRKRKKDREDIVTIREFLFLVVDNWDKYQINTKTAFEGNYVHRIATLPQKKQALWLIHMLKKHYVDQK